jgi:uncharacterized membrane-anchored protein YhcB (DUF1043 family)
MIATLWARFSTWIVAALGVIAGIAAVYLRGRSAGKAVEQKKSTQRDLKAAQKHAETIRETIDVQTEVSRLPDSDVRERLRDKWQRD